MNTIDITAKKDFLQQISSAPALKALAELIWNGFDAGADRVSVTPVTNALGGLEELRVRDNGSGIYQGHVRDLFGNLGESWKRNQPRMYGRFLHGRKGQGRFKGFAIGNRVEWRSCYEYEGERFRYRISGQADALTELQFSDPVPCEDETGTEVVISDIRGTFGSLLSDKAPLDLAKIFGVYLKQYPQLQLSYHDRDVRPEDAIQLEKKQEIADLQFEIQEWKMAARRAIQLCDGDGHLLEELDVGPAVRAPGYHFTAKVCSDRFRDLERENRLSLGELEPEIAVAAELAREALREHFRERREEAAGEQLEAWVAEGSHPFLDLPAEAPQRRAFEQLAIHLDDHGAGIRGLDSSGRLLYFHLLASLLVYHPEGLAPIVEELFPMKQEARKALQRLML